MIRSRPRRPPLVRQLNQTECGLCCCAILLGTQRSPSGINELRQQYTVGRDGLNISDIAEILRQQGATPHVYEVPAAGVPLLDRPAICYWNQNHFVVARFTARGHVTIIDPGAGRSTIDPEEFSERFSGYAITIDPDPRHLASELPSPLRILLGFARGHLVLLAATLLVALGSALTTLWLPTVLSVTFGGRAGSGGTSALPFAVLAGVVIANTLILLVRSLVSLISATAVGKAMSEAVFSRMLRLPYGHLVHRGVGELLFTLDSVQRLRALITTDFIVVVVGLVMVGTLLVWLAVQSWTAALVALGLVALLALLALMSGRGVRRLSLEETRRRAELQSIQVTALSGLESIKTNAMEDHYVARWRRTNDAVQRYSVGLQSVQSGFTSLSASLQLVGPILIVLIITSGSSGGPVAATIVSVQALVGLLLGQVGQVTGSFSQVAQGWTLLERVSEIMVRPEDDTFAGAAAPPPGAEIAVLDVTFSYATFSPAVLDGVTLHVPAGAKVALVGPSGSGKSTLGRLIVGLSRPTTGQITIGGRELHEYGRHPFYSNVAYVPQNVVLDSGTLRDNIAWGAGEVDDDAILLAAERVGLSEDIAALPLGLDTPVAQLGQNFSGGQRQRVALARAALKRVSLVVLDEATSSLDNRAEATVTRYFSSLAATSVVIAHRLSTVIDADVIYVMAAGRVVEHGTHADLIRQDGLYRELYRRSSEQISVDG